MGVWVDCLGGGAKGYVGPPLKLLGGGGGGGRAAPPTSSYAYDKAKMFSMNICHNGLQSVYVFYSVRLTTFSSVTQSI